MAGNENNNNGSVNNPFKEFGGDLHLTPAPPNTTRVPAKDWIANYMQSPMYKKRLNKMGITQVPSPDRILSSDVTFNNGEGTVYQHSPHWYNDKDVLNVDMNQLNNIKEHPDFAVTHELSHGSRVLSNNESTLIASINKDINGKSLYKEYNDLLKYGYNKDYNSFLNDRKGKYWYIHDNDPKEQKADLDAFRFMMHKKGIYDTSSRDMTINDFNKAKADKDISGSMIFNRLLKSFSPDDIIRINNTIAMNNANGSDLTKTV